MIEPDVSIGCAIEKEVESVANSVALHEEPGFGAEFGVCGVVKFAQFVEWIGKLVGGGCGLREPVKIGEWGDENSLADGALPDPEVWFQ